MTIKRRDTGEDFTINQGWTTKSFRLAVVVLIASMHPVGRELLNAAGFKIPRDPGIVAEEVKHQTSIQTETVTQQITDLSKKVDTLTTNMADAERRFTGFQLDFERYKNRPVQVEK